jgi:diguanylate cyclase (GGDEF)-like protein
MASGTHKTRIVLLCALAFIILDLVCSSVSSRGPSGVNYIGQIIAPFLALMACTWRAQTVSGRARALWVLLSTGLVLWNFALWLSAYEDLTQLVPFQVAALSDVLFFFYGVPVLLALSTPADGQRSWLFTLLDGVQGIFAGYLTYITIFSVAPFSASAIQPISITLLVATYNAENAVLACSSAIRLLASPRQGEEHRFYRTLCIFLVVYLAGAGIYNQIQVETNGITSWNILADLPFLLLAALIMLLPPVAKSEVRSEVRKSPLILFIDNASPILFTVALLTMGMFVLRHSFATGAFAIGLGLAAYGFRTTTLQIRYIHAQHALQAARDRLEEISLQDSLTSIANRRRFDQTLESEWHRARRTRHCLSLLLIDLDYFKNLNDTHGHPYGDRCLTEVAAALRAVAARSGDLVARYGGEEFAAILPATTRADAESIAIRMQEAVAALKIQNDTEVGRFLSISVGIASYVFPEAGTPSQLIDAADRALYKAKQNGRNRVELAEMQMTLGETLSL